jgi:CDP-paratose 2-epimerase
MSEKLVIITGGAGFIGCNAANHYLGKGWRVEVWDNLSRRGGESNLDWLRSQGDFDFQKIDVRNAAAVSERMAAVSPDLIIHCAGQVAVTTSVTDPRLDMEVNLIGTFNLLEAVRAQAPEAFFIYACTNKVYGGMEDLGVVSRNGRYEYEDLPGGVGEERSLDFHSPYGCSKGAADQYVRDYHRIYGLSTVSFRQSCIYGQRQFGIEDQGWVAWFTIAHALKRKVTIFGDGCQTRDILHIDDLAAAYDAAFEARERTVGQVYNIGGGPKNLLSLHELTAILNELRGYPLEYSYADWRPGDQKVFVADIAKAERDFGWRPEHDSRAGIGKLAAWVDRNLDQLKDL